MVVVKMSNIYLVLGGVRSGKSAYAEALACKNKHKKIYIATAGAFDEEMEKRIKSHRVRRGDDWQTIEEQVEISRIIDMPIANNQQPITILVDCLTLWMSNLLHREMDVMAQIDLLINALKTTQADVILVSSEVGMGIVPENALARQFRDYAGILHQRVAEVADSVVLVVAGIPLTIKGA